MQVPAKFHF